MKTFTALDGKAYTTETVQFDQDAHGIIGDSYLSGFLGAPVVWIGSEDVAIAGRIALDSMRKKFDANYPLIAEFENGTWGRLDDVLNIIVKEN